MSHNTLRLQRTKQRILTSLPTNKRLCNISFDGDDDNDLRMGECTFDQQSSRTGNIILLSQNALTRRMSSAYVLLLTLTGHTDAVSLD